MITRTVLLRLLFHVGTRLLVFVAFLVLWGAVGWKALGEGQSLESFLILIVLVEGYRRIVGPFARGFSDKWAERKKRKKRK